MLLQLSLQSDLPVQTILFDNTNVQGFYADYSNPPMIVGTRPFSFGFALPGRSYDSFGLDTVYIGLTRSSAEQVRTDGPIIVNIRVTLRPIVGDDFHPCSCTVATMDVQMMLTPPRSTSTTTDGDCGPGADPALLSTCGIPNYIGFNSFPPEFLLDPTVADNWALTIQVLGAVGASDPQADNLE